MTSPAKRSLVIQLLERFCAQNDLKLTSGDPHGHAGMVEDTSGKRWFFKGTRFDLNTLGASEIANDKAYAAKFLADNGVPIPASYLVQTSAIREDSSLFADSLEFSENTGYPLYLKPNIGQEGLDVVRVDTDQQLQAELGHLAAKHEQLLLQEGVAGQELRIVVLDDEILCAIERCPPQVTGDGVRDIGELLEGQPMVDRHDLRIESELFRQSLTIACIPAEGRQVAVLPVTNLSSGGSARFVTDDLSPDVGSIACKAVQTLGLRYAGVDLIIRDDVDHVSPAIVLEVNAAPGLSNLSRQGPKEAEIVERIYQKIFETAFLKDGVAQ
ncbi:Cyanophycin synthetase [Roseibium album]|nr:Cyanophycin synthetase [Roseibium album]